MGWFDGAGAKVADLVKTYNNIDLKVSMMERALDTLKSEFSLARADQLKLGERVSRLEENRETVKAEMQSVATKAVAEVQVMKANIEADLRVENMKQQAELYRHHLENEIKRTPPQLPGP